MQNLIPLLALACPLGMAAMMGVPALMSRIGRNTPSSPTIQPTGGVLPQRDGH